MGKAFAMADAFFRISAHPADFSFATATFARPAERKFLHSLRCSITKYPCGAFGPHMPSLGVSSLDLKAAERRPPFLGLPAWRVDASAARAGRATALAVSASGREAPAPGTGRRAEARRRRCRAPTPNEMCHWVGMPAPASPSVAANKASIGMSGSRSPWTSRTGGGAPRASRAVASPSLSGPDQHPRIPDDAGRRPPTPQADMQRHHGSLAEADQRQLRLVEAEARELGVEERVDRAPRLDDAVPAFLVPRRIVRSAYSTGRTIAGPSARRRSAPGRSATRRPRSAAACAIDGRSRSGRSRPRRSRAGRPPARSPCLRSPVSGVRPAQRSSG